MNEPIEIKEMSGGVDQSGVSLAGQMAPNALKMALAAEEERRSLIKEFVSKQLSLNKDYGSITLPLRSGGRTESKPVLFKAGMEKIFSLFNVVSSLEKDVDTLDMIGKPGVIAYKCLISRGGMIIGEGRGACDPDEKRNSNERIKIAEKRARMDACLNLGFSEYFTQDLEDMTDQPGEADDAQTKLATAAQREMVTEALADGTLVFTAKKVFENQKQDGSGTYFKVMTQENVTLFAFDEKIMEAIFEGKSYKAKVATKGKFTSIVEIATVAS